MNRQCPDPAPVDAEIERVRSLGVDALRSRWQSMFGCRPPPGFTKDLLARMIAHRIQEEAFGGLGRETLRVLERLARGETPGQLGRRLKPGTVLVREYQGIRHSVTIVPDGFLWQDQIYPSLSNIARAITGTSWNGPRFFGLRMSSWGRPQRSCGGRTGAIGQQRCVGRTSGDPAAHNTWSRPFRRRSRISVPYRASLKCERLARRERRGAGRLAEERPTRCPRSQ